MDATKLIEEAEREIAHMKAEALSAANPYTENTIRLTLIIDLAAALKASEERARKAEELAAANLAANKRIVELEQQVADAAALRRQDAEHCERLIVDRDAARAELARLTTPRPIAEAPRDGTVVLGCDDKAAAGALVYWDAETWTDGEYEYHPTKFLYLPLLEVKP